MSIIWNISTIASTILFFKLNSLIASMFLASASSTSNPAIADKDDRRQIIFSKSSAYYECVYAPIPSKLPNGRLENLIERPSRVVALLCNQTLNVITSDHQLYF
jgi:hypothetical protein